MPSRPPPGHQKVPAWSLRATSVVELLLLGLLVASVPLIGILGGAGLATMAAVRLLGRRAETLIDSLAPPHPDAAIHP